MAEELRDDEKFVVMADVPGLHPDRDISISITTDILRIRAGNGDQIPDTDLRDGQFSRDIQLPPGIDAWHVSATYVDGVLEVRAPMRERSSATQVVPVATNRSQSSL